ncbi:protein FAM187B-like [Heterocephalus glaber]|uniref:Protein FAM187B-like n=1 Tax=Heterocephalus glaber TaxID=10181 RepID=A0AAX6RFH3_HETGA|nr:protein FAM187B-like [Heterocephalus glaber]
MLTTLRLLLSLSAPVLGFYIPISCPEGHKCQLALLSGDDILLECPLSRAHWNYSFVISKKSGAINSMASNMEITSEGNLAITNPLLSQTGLYYCWKENSQVTQFKIDFQDVHSLYITHENLDKKPLQNESLRVGGIEIIFTRWETWQDCNRCGVPGEWKRLGYCYIAEPLEDPMPCGLYLAESPHWFSRLRPELQVEACFVECNDNPFAQLGYVIFDSFRFNEELAPLSLPCPLASIYRPVSWEANNISLTWENELLGKNYNRSLNLASGGRQLQIFQPATYRCFMEQEFIAQFNPIATLEFLGPQKRENKTQGPSRKADSIPLRLKLVLLMGTALALGVLLFNTLCSAPGKRRNQMLLAK